MAHLPACVPLEECTSLLQQFRCHCQVDLRVRHADVPKVDRKVIDQPLHVGPLTVPRRQAVDRKSVPKIVQSRLLARPVSPKGETTVQTKDFAGTSCREATKTLEQALGAVQADKATAEMYQTATAGQQIKQSAG